MCYKGGGVIVRTKAWWFAALLLVGARSAIAEETVTLHMMARPLGEVVAEVARQSQLPLGADRSAAGLPVFVSVKDMPVKVLLSRLQAATGTEWLEEGERVVLSKAGPLRAARAAESRQLAQRLQRRVDTYLKGANSSFDWSTGALEERVRKIIRRRDEHHKTNVTEFAFQVDSETPYHLVIKEFLERVPATAFTSIPPNSNLVFSTRPNDLQSALPYRPEAPGVARGLEQELHRRLVKAGIRFWGKEGHDVAAPPVRPPVDRLIVRVERYELTSFTFHAFLVGPVGEVIATSSYSTVAYPESSSFTPSQYPSGRVQLSPRSAEFASSFRSYTKLLPMRYRPESQGKVLGGGLFEECTSESLKQLMREPAKVDPLSFVVADVLEGLAEQTQSQLVAMVPDSLLGRLAQSGAKGEVPLIALWQSYATVSFSKDEHGWLIRPRSFGAAADEFADRQALQNVVQAPSLREIARYATTMGSHWASGAVDYLWFDLLQNQVQTALFHHRDHFKLLGALATTTWPSSPGQVARVPLSSLPASAMPIALMVLQKTAAELGNGDLNQRRNPTEIAYREPTEMLGGVADRISIEIRRDRSDLLAAVRNGTPDRVMNPFEFGRLGPGAPAEVMLVDVDQIAVAFTAGGAPHGQTTLMFRQLREPRNIYTPSTLPESVKSKVEQGRRSRGSG